MPITNQYLQADFGTGFGGLAIPTGVGYEFFDTAGASLGARSVVGVAEVATGIYKVLFASIADAAATIVWDTGVAGGSIPATEDLDPYHDRNAIRTNADVLTSSRAAPGDAMDLITDALDSDAVATSGAQEIRDEILDDATRFSGANIDAAITSRPTAAQINTELEVAAGHGAGSWQTATGFAVPGDPMTLTGGTLSSLRQSPVLDAELSVDGAFITDISKDSTALEVDLVEE